MASPRSDIWAAVERLIDAAPTLEDLREHRLHLLAARRWRAAGRPVPAALKLDERRSVAAALAATALLRCVREACDGPVIVIKGPEVAARYPDAVLRGYGDVDVLVPDPQEAQRALVAAGFVPIGDPRVYGNIHHLRPLALGALPLPLELHSSPKWPDGFDPPPLAELLEAALPGSIGIDGVQQLHPAHHAIVLAAHSWAHDPLRRVGELVDVAVMSQGLDPAELRALAARWGLPRIWNATAAAAGALFDGRRTPWPLRTWARHLPAVRDRTVIESHFERWLSAFWASPFRVASAHLGATLVRELMPAPGERVGAKLSRTRVAVRNARVARSLHGEEIERAGVRAPLFYELESREDDGEGADR